MAFRTKAAVDVEDYVAWLDSQAQALRDHRWSALDADSIADELEALSRSERRALEADLAVVLMHLLKWQHQPTRRSKSWIYSIAEHSDRIVRLLSESPSLRPRLAGLEVDAYTAARLRAASETGLDLELFPEEITAAMHEELEHVLADAVERSQRAKARKQE